MRNPIDITGFRKERGWTQGRLAGELGVDVSTVWRWEHWGMPKKGPIMKAIERLADQYPPVEECAQ